MMTTFWEVIERLRYQEVVSSSLTPLNLSTASVVAINANDDEIKRLFLTSPTMDELEYVEFACALVYGC